MSKDISMTSGMVGKMGIFLLMITVTVLFGALSLGFFWAPSSGPYQIPPLFYLNTALLVPSSVILHVGWENRQRASGRQQMTVAMILGIAFLIGQCTAYWQLSEHGMWISNSGRKMQYLYVLSGLHGLHLVGGLTFLAAVLFGNGKRREKIGELALYFWHFLGFLWVYLLIVLLMG